MYSLGPVLLHIHKVLLQPVCRCTCRINIVIAYWRFYRAFHFVIARDLREVQLRDLGAFLPGWGYDVLITAPLTGHYRVGI
jgi:hypothetical protein